MREFMHGNEWWGQRNDGTWVRWNNEFKKTLGARPDQIEPGAKTFQWRCGKTFGPFPLEGAATDPSASPEELSRAALRLASLKVHGAQLWLGIILAALVLGASHSWSGWSRTCGDQ